MLFWKLRWFHRARESDPLLRCSYILRSYEKTYPWAAVEFFRIEITSKCRWKLAIFVIPHRCSMFDVLITNDFFLSPALYCRKSKRWQRHLTTRNYSAIWCEITVYEYSTSIGTTMYWDCNLTIYRATTATDRTHYRFAESLLNVYLLSVKR